MPWLNTALVLWIHFVYIYIEGTVGVIVIFLRNRHSDPSLNPGQGCLYFT